MEPWLRDIRLAVRRLRLAPGFTVFAIASLAIGIGVSTAIYSAVRTLFWMPMGISDPERVMSWTVTGRFVPAMSWPDFLDVRAQQSSFASIAAARRMAAAVSIGTTVETVFGESVSGEYFETLGLTPRRGRLLHAQDEAGRARVAVVSESFWRTRLDGDSAVIGRLFKLGGETFEIVGVVSGTFHGVHAMLPSSIWIARDVFKTTDVVGRTVTLHPWRRIVNAATPEAHTVVGISADTDTFMLSRRGNPPMFVPLAQHYEAGLTFSARAADPSAAVRALRSAIQRVDPELAISSIGTGTRLLVGPFFVLRVIAGLATALGGVALVLAMAGLYGVLSHVVARRTREIGIRLALGADRAGIFRLILRDGLRPVIKGLVIGGIVGVLLRVALRATVVTTLSPIDVVVFAAAPLPFLVAALAACYLPAQRASRVDPNVALRDL